MKIIDGHDVIEHSEVNGEDREFIRILMDYIEDADVVEPKQGEWIWTQYDGNPAIGNYHCSICRWLVPHDKYAFCPNCGVRMKGTDNE